MIDYCRHCRAPLTQNETVCPACGRSNAPEKTDDPFPALDGPEAIDLADSSRKKLSLRGCVLIVSLVLLVFWLFLGTIKTVVTPPSVDYPTSFEEMEFDEDMEEDEEDVEEADAPACGGFPSQEEQTPANDRNESPYDESIPDDLP
ncbi:MAG TPA: hypothetical protein PKW95_09150 [bacterium]|nr:hypothetical protein [bacterium]